MNINPIWHSTTSTEASGIGSAAASAICQSTLAPPGTRTDLATSIMSGAMSIPMTVPVSADSLGGGAGDVAGTACDIDDVLTRLEIGYAQQVLRHRCGDEGHEVALVVLGCRFQ